MMIVVRRVRRANVVVFPSGRCRESEEGGSSKGREKVETNKFFYGPVRVRATKGVELAVGER